MRAAALLLLGKYCGWRASQIEQYLPLSDLALVQVAELQIADVDYIKAKLDKTRVPFYVAYVLSAMRNIQDARVMDLALPYLTNGDRSLQAAAISVLRSKAYAGQAVMPLLDSPFEEVRYQAYLWLQTTNPKLARQYVIQRVGEMDPGSTLRVVNAKAPLAADEVRLLRGKLFGTEKEQAASACVLSAKLRPNQVIELLTSRFQSVRDGARSCLSLNDGAQQVFALAGKLEGFAAFDQLGLRELAETVRLGQQEVNRAPTWARTWRMRLFFATHRGLIGSPSAFASFDPELM